MIDKRTLKVLKYIYKHPYTSYKSINKRFSKYFDIENIVCSLEANKFISFRVASCASDDEGYEELDISDIVHLLCLPLGNHTVENDKSLFRGELRSWLTTIIAFSALVLSVLSLIWQYDLHF